MTDEGKPNPLEVKIISEKTFDVESVVVESLDLSLTEEEIIAIESELDG